MSSAAMTLTKPILYLMLHFLLCAFLTSSQVDYCVYSMRIAWQPSVMLPYEEILWGRTLVRCPYMEAYILLSWQNGA